MEKDLGQRSKEEAIAHLEQERIALKKANEDLIEERKRLEAEKSYLTAQVKALQRLIYGQKRERFISNTEQLPLPFEPSSEVKHEQQETTQEKITYTRTKHKKNHPGRAKLPENLPVEEIEIHPEGDLSEMVCIGKDVTEELECEPAKFFIKRYIRYKYAPKTGEGAHKIAQLPERVIDKGIPGVGLLTLILINKYVDHLPLYRQQQIFKRSGIRITPSTINNWVKRSIEKLEILYESLVTHIKSKGYLQADETPIKVLDSDKKNATHQGYFWVYHDPIDQIILFDYQPTRGYAATQDILGDFKGYLQSDGYAVYEKIAKKPAITHIACWAHARREFVRAKDNDQARAEKALTFIQQLYTIEKKAREEKMTAEQRKALRIEQALPILNQMGKWISEENKKTLPKSPIGKAFAYCIYRWKALSDYLLDGNLEIDNNLTENAIRPVALGRKNYLFAGSHEAAQRSAIIYTFFANCKKHEVDPYQWLRNTLQNIMSTSIQELHTLYPQNFTESKPA